MHNLLIVDDEPLILAGIQSMIDWGESNINIIGTATNGDQAFNIIKKENPEIVITDIKMPLLSGMELIKKCHKEFNSPPKFIVLTSFEDFNLLRQGMRLSIVDYLIKLELTPESLLKSIDKAKTFIEKNSTSDKTTNNSDVVKVFKQIFFIKLLNSVFLTEEEINRYKVHAGVELSGDKYSVILCKIKYIKSSLLSITEKKKIILNTIQILKEVFERSTGVYLQPMDSELFVIIIAKEKNKKEHIPEDQILKSILKRSIGVAEKYYNTQIICGIGSLYSSIQHIPKSYREAQTALTFASLDDPFTLYNDISESLESASLDLFITHRENLRSALKCYDVDLLDQVMHKLVANLKSGESLFSISMDVCTSFLHELLTYVSNAEEILSIVFKNEVNGYHCLYEMTNVNQSILWLESIKKELLSTFRDKRTGYIELLSEQIKKYIDKHFLEKIELKDIGNHFKMSPNYLCTIFRNYNNEGISSYQNFKRIEKARELLILNSYKIYEISEMTGFESPYYFSKVFKRVTGKSPSSWLNEIENIDRN